MATRTVPADIGLAHEVVARARADLDTLVTHIADRIFGEVEFYAAAGAGTREEFLPLLQANVEAALNALVGAHHNPNQPAETGRIRARQNAPLADVLSAYRLGYIEVLAAVIRAGQQEPPIPAEVLINFGQMVFETHNRDCDALIHAFRAEAHEILLSEERERAALIDALLSEDPGLGTILDVASALRLPIDGRLMVVAASCRLGQDPMPRVASALGVAEIPSVWRLRHDVAIGILSLPRAGRAEAALEVLRKHASGPVGVSPVFGSVRQAAWGLRMARLALPPTNSAAVSQFQDTPLNMLLVGGKDAAAQTAAKVLGGLSDLPADARDLLLDTLVAWVEAGGSADRTGELLHCHPNTIRKRLKRVEEHTGRSLSEPGGVAEVLAATQVWLQTMRS